MRGHQDKPTEEELQGVGSGMDWMVKGRWCLSETLEDTHIQCHSERGSTALQCSHVARESEARKDADRQKSMIGREPLCTYGHTHHSGTASCHCPLCRRVWDTPAVHRFDCPSCAWPWPGPGILW